MYILDDFYAIGTSATGVTLTNEYSDNYKDIFVDRASQLIIDVEYTPAENGGKIMLQYEFGLEITDYYKYTVKNSSSTARTVYITPTEFTGSSAGTVYKFEDAINCGNKWFRISVKESGVSSYGTATIRIIKTEIVN